MTILIAHRGNTAGPNQNLENSLPYLEIAIEAGYDVEVDVWMLNNEWYFGHNSPKYRVTPKQLSNLSGYAWFHAKNYFALAELTNANYHVFAHSQDPYVVTNRGIIWSHNGVYNPHGIVCMPNLLTEQILLKECKGICHDYLTTVQGIINEQ